MIRINSAIIFNTVLKRASPVYRLSSCKYSKKSEAELVKVESKVARKESQRLSEFRKKLRETTPIDDLGVQPLTPPAVKEDPLLPWPDNRNPHTGELNGPRGPEPTRYGDWERKGRVSDF